MNDILKAEPEKQTQQAISTWKKLGVLTDAKIRQLSTEHGASSVPIDGTVEVKRWEANGKIYQSWVKKGTTREHGVVRIIKPNNWFEERQEKDGRKHGYARLIWHDGRYETEYFKDGLRHGPEHAYDQEGNKKYIQHYKEGETGKREEF